MCVGERNDLVDPTRLLRASRAISVEFYRLKFPVAVFTPLQHALDVFITDCHDGYSQPRSSRSLRSNQLDVGCLRYVQKCNLIFLRVIGTIFYHGCNHTYQLGGHVSSGHFCVICVPMVVSICLVHKKSCPVEQMGLAVTGNQHDRGGWLRPVREWFDGPDQESGCFDKHNVQAGWSIICRNA